MVLGFFISSCLGLIMILPLIRFGSGAVFINLIRFIEILRFSFTMFVWSAMQRLSGRGNLLVAGIFLTSEELGVFGILLRIPLIFTFFQTAVNQTIFVEFSLLNHLDTQSQLKRLLESSATVLMALCTIIAIPMMIRPV